MDYTILKLENGDFVKIAERPTREDAQRCAAWNAAADESEHVVYEVRNKAKTVTDIIRKTPANG